MVAPLLELLLLIVTVLGFGTHDTDHLFSTSPQLLKRNAQGKCHVKLRPIRQLPVSFSYGGQSR